MKIGFVGKAGVGKDTAAAILAERIDLPIIPFAKPLHDAAKCIWGINCLNRDQKEREQEFGEKIFNLFEERHLRFAKIIGFQITHAHCNLLREVFSVDGKIVETISPRRFMQLYGTEFWRKADSAFFINLLRDKSCIIPDVRFENEATICDCIIVINRNVPDVAGHSSEQLANMFTNIREGYFGKYLGVTDTTIIGNNGSIDDLRRKLHNLNF